MYQIDHVFIAIFLSNITTDLILPTLFMKPSVYNDEVEMMRDGFFRWSLKIIGWVLAYVALRLLICSF